MAQSQNASLAASTNSECQVLKRQSDDIGWEYGDFVDPTNRDKVKCLLCERK